MHISRFVCFSVNVAVIAVLAAVAMADEKIPQKAAVRITSPQVPPDWALQERLLLRENTRALEKYFSRYFDDRGFLKCKARWSIADGADDAMEACGNWPLLYALGADRSVVEMFKKVYEGHLKQYSRKDVEYAPEWGCFYKEYITSFDAQHGSEQYSAFNQLALADPSDKTFRKRICRYAGFHMNEGLPRGAEPNYNYDLKLMRSALVGSRGALMQVEPKFWGHEFDKWPTIDARARITHNWTRVAGDFPWNMMLAPTFAANAFFLTGEQKYRAWVLDYVDTWCRLAEENGGIFPANVGLSGKIGEYFDGKWWLWWHGRWDPELMRGIQNGLEIAMVLSGDRKYMEPLRRQIGVLHENMIEEKGKKYPPAYRDDNGWSGKTRFEEALVRTYLTDFRDDDLKLIEEEVQRDTPDGNFRYNAGYFYHVDDYPWLYFVLGRNPDFPRRIMEADMARIQQRMRGMSQDKTVDWERRSDDTQGFNPVSTHALVNLTCGGVGPVWDSTLLLTEVWHFDPERKRPGLPPDVAALVDSITKDSVGLHVVNCCQTEPRTVVVQGGAYGEHRILEIEAAGKKMPVNGHYATVELAPGAGGRLVLKVQRLANRPSAGLPWEREMIVQPRK